MKHAIRIAAIVAAASFAACFGAGPEPLPPNKATILYGVAPRDPSQCAWTFLGDVAFSTDLGFVFEIPYGPSECGGTTPTAPINVVQFAKTGGQAMRIGSAGMTSSNFSMNPGEPRLIVVDGENEGVEWTIYDLNQTHITIHTKSGSDSVALGPSDPPSSTLSIPGAGGSGVYIATEPGAGSQPDDIYFPGRGLAQSTMMMGPGAIRRVQNMAGSAPAQCGYANHCMAANSTDVYYFGTNGSAPNQVVVRRFAVNTDPPDAGHAGNDYGMLSTNAPMPTGIVTDGDTGVIYASTGDYNSQIPDTGQPVCQIMRRDLVSMQATPLLMTSNFSCFDLASDGVNVYFAITTVLPSDQDNNGGPNNNNTLHGLGIGRVEIATGNYNSVATGIQGVTSGPRRVFVDGSAVYAIDPHVIGKIDKALFYNANDFPK